MSGEEGREGGEWQKMGRKQVTKKQRYMSEREEEYIKKSKNFS